MHELDANTIALWRMDDTVASDYANILDSSGNGYDLPVTGAIDIIGGPDGVGLAKAFSTDAALHANDATLTSLFTGEWSLEGWFYPGDNTRDYAWAYGAAGETQDANFLVSVVREIGGNITVFSEKDAGTNININSTANLPQDTWTHLAITKESTGGGTYDYLFYVNGVLADTVSGDGSNTVASTASLSFGSNAAASYWTGGLGPQRWSDVVRSAGEIAASFARASKDHANDASTVINLLMIERPDLFDEANFIHLRLTSGVDEAASALISDAGKSRTFAETQYDSPADWAPITDALLTALHSDMTVEFWGRLAVTWETISSRGPWVFGDPGSETSDDNFYSFDVLASRIGRVFSEHGAGINDVWDTPVAVISAENQWSAHHYAITSVASGGFTTYEVYIDGVLIDTSDGTDITHDGGESNQWRLGTGGSAAILRWLGHLDDMRISSVRRSPAEILASFEAGALGGGDTSPPIVTNMAPVPGEVTKNDQISFDVTDVSPGTVLIVIHLKYTSSTETIVVHDGAEFKPPFDTVDSSRVAIADGYTYTVRPSGGWTGGFLLEVLAVDGDGNLLS